jgi:hypothetical protein
MTPGPRPEHFEAIARSRQQEQAVVSPLEFEVSKQDFEV